MPACQAAAAVVMVVEVGPRMGCSDTDRAVQQPARLGHRIPRRPCGAHLSRDGLLPETRRQPLCSLCPGAGVSWALVTEGTAQSRRSSATIQQCRSRALGMRQAERQRVCPVCPSSSSPTLGPGNQTAAHGNWGTGSWQNVAVFPMRN